jgi:hypothetical protein
MKKIRGNIIVSFFLYKQKVRRNRSKTREGCCEAIMKILCIFDLIVFNLEGVRKKYPVIVKSEGGKSVFFIKIGKAG